MDNESQELRKALLPELYAEIRWWRTAEQWTFTIFATVLVVTLAWTAQNPGKIGLATLIAMTIVLPAIWATFTFYLRENLRRSMTVRRMLHSIQVRVEVTEITEASERWSKKGHSFREHSGTLHFWCVATILSLLLLLEAWWLNFLG